MALQTSVTLRQNQALQNQATIWTTGAAPTLVFYTGSQPSTCATAASGTLLATLTLPTALFSSTSGVVSLSGTWAGTVSTAGTAGYFRILDNAGNCHMQGNLTTDLVMNSTAFSSGQSISITAYTITITPTP